MAAMDMINAPKLADPAWVMKQFKQIAERAMPQLELTESDTHELNVIGAWFAHAMLQGDGVVLSEGAATGMMLCLVTAYLTGRLSDGVTEPGAEIPEVFREFLSELLEADDAGGA